MRRQPPGRKRNRGHRRKAYAKLAAGGLLFVPLALLSTIFLMCVLAEWVVGGNAGDPFAHTIAVIAMLLAGALVSAWLARMSLRAVEQGLSEVSGGASAENSEHLPVEQVLVRGAEEPAGASETLLRAAAPGQAEAGEELLRGAAE